MLAFIHIEKAAGSTTIDVLRRSFGRKHGDSEPMRRNWSIHSDCFSAADLRRMELVYGRLESVSGHGIKPCSDLESHRRDLRYLTLLRQPIERCISHYQYQRLRMGKSVAFEEWIEDPRYRNFQVRKIAGTEDLDEAVRILEQKVSFTGLVERFDESLVLMRAQFSDTPLDIRYRKKNVASDRSIESGIKRDEGKMAALRRANDLDLQFYRHVCEKVYPAQRAAYGEQLESDVAAFRANKMPAAFSWNRVTGEAKRRLVYRPWSRYCARTY